MVLNPLRYLARLTNCKEASRLMSQGQERQLSRRDRMRLWFHLRRCLACQRFERQLGFLRAASRRLRS